MIRYYTWVILDLLATYILAAEQRTQSATRHPIHPHQTTIMYTELPCFKVPKSPSLLAFNFSSFPLEGGAISSAPTTCSEVLAPAHRMDFQQAFTPSAPRCLYTKERAATHGMHIRHHTLHPINTKTRLPLKNLEWTPRFSGRRREQSLLSSEL